MPTQTQAKAPRTRRGEQRPTNGEHRLTNDHATYTCVCGFVFAAPVTTSVDCPHCGDTQAW
jgi:hypothetical protein